MATKRQGLSDPKDILNDDDSFWDDDAAGVTNLSTDFGEKFKLGDKAGDIPRFVGIYVGIKEVPNDETGEIMRFAEFTDAEGERAYCSIFYALNEQIENEAIIEGDIVRMVFKGEVETKRGLNPAKKVEIKVKRP